MPETTHGRLLSFARVLFVSGVAAGLGGMLTAHTGCASTTSTGAESGTESAAESDPAPEPVVSLSGNSPAESGSGTGLRPTVVGDVTIDHAAFRDLGLRWDWSMPGAVGSRVGVSYIKADDDFVYMLDKRNVLRLFSSNDGTRRWGVEVGDPIEKFVGVDRVDDILLVSSQAELFVYSVEGGNLLRRSSYGQSVGTSPVRAGSILIYGTPTGELLGFNYVAAGGQKAWGNSNQRGAIDTSPVLMGGFVGAVSDAGDVIFCDARTGQIVARKEIFGGTDSTPASDGNVMVIAGLDQSLWAFRPDGRLFWRHRTERPIHGTPVIHDGVVYCELGDESQIAVRMSDADERGGDRAGDIVWQTDGLLGTLVHASENGLLFWDQDTRTLTLADRNLGDVIASTRLESVERVIADDLDAGNVYIASQTGVIVKFTTR